MLNLRRLAIVAAIFALNLAASVAAEPEPKQYLASVTVEELKDGRTVTLCSPKLLFAAGKDAQIQVGNSTHNVEIIVSTVTKKKRLQHVVETKIIDAPHSDNPKIVAFPRLVLRNNTTATIECGNVKISAVIEPVKSPAVND